MAKDYSLRNATILTMLDIIDADINAGTQPVVRLYDANTTAPVNADAALGGCDTLVVTLNGCATNFFGAATDVCACNLGRLTANCITDGTAAACGTACFFRILADAAGAVITQGTVGIGACFDLNMNTNVINNGATVSITSMTLDLLE